jgi:hypothetical protein
MSGVRNLKEEEGIQLGGYWGTEVGHELRPLRELLFCVLRAIALLVVGLGKPSEGAESSCGILKQLGSTKHTPNAWIQQQ